MTVAGLQGTQFDAEVDPEKAYEALACEGTTCVIVFGFGDALYHFPVENKWRVVALDADGKQVVLVIEATKADFDAFTTKAEKILRTLRFPST